MVCMANICRSPMALVVATKLSKESGLSARFMFDSAGTHAERGRKRSDARVESVLLSRHYPPLKGRTRRIDPADFEKFDLIVAMDRGNLSALCQICPAQHQDKLRLLLTFAPEVGLDEVPDPYFGNLEGFERVLDLCEAGVKGLLNAYLPQTL
jgi:protein-tyrosine phosphatase